MIKAAFFDVDGTLVSFRTHTVSSADLEALHRLRSRGVKLFVSTGRHPVMLSYIRSVFPFDGYITLNGQYSFTPEQVVQRVTMEPQAVEELVSAVSDGDFSCIFLEEKEIYLNRINDLTVRFMDTLDLKLPPAKDLHRALEHDVYQAIAFLTRDNEHLLLDRAPHLKTTRWHPEFLDVLPSAGGKDRGMDALLRHFNIPLDQTIAFGDGENDLSMLRHAGIGVAMGSASPEVCQAADYVTGTVDESGVFRALEHFALI